MRDGKNVIFCIDDDPDVLSFLKLALEANGAYVVETAFSAEEGRRKFQVLKPDAVIVDLMMEEIDSGVAFVKDIKAMGSEVPVYMLSAAGNQLSQTVDYSELGLDGVLHKPINPEILHKLLSARLSR